MTHGDTNHLICYPVVVSPIKSVFKEKYSPNRYKMVSQYLWAMKEPDS